MKWCKRHDFPDPDSPAGTERIRTRSLAGDQGISQQTNDDEFHEEVWWPLWASVVGTENQKKQQESTVGLGELDLRLGIAAAIVLAAAAGHRGMRRKCHVPRGLSAVCCFDPFKINLWTRRERARLEQDACNDGDSATDGDDAHFNDIFASGSPSTSFRDPALYFEHTHGCENRP